MVLYGENEIDCWKKEKRGITSDGKKNKKNKNIRCRGLRGWKIYQGMNQEISHIVELSSLACENWWWELNKKTGYKEN